MDAVRFHRLAAQEFRFARTWYRQRDSSVAARFRDAVDSATNRIAADADSHPALSDDIRWVRVRRFPYILVFVRESPDSLLVLARAKMSRLTAWPTARALDAGHAQERAGRCPRG